MNRRVRIYPREALLNVPRSEEHTSELQSQPNLVCRLLLEKKKDHHRRDRGRHARIRVRRAAAPVSVRGPAPTATLGAKLHDAELCPDQLRGFGLLTQPTAS